MLSTADAPPISWPSLSDLAHLLGVKLSTLSRLAEVRRRPTQRVGREVKVPPAEAVAILVARGLSERTATQRVRAVVERRQVGVPGLRASDQPPAGATAAGRLVRSSTRPTDAPRLERSDLAVRHLPAPRVPAGESRYAALDHRFAGRVIPLERYIYAASR